MNLLTAYPANLSKYLLLLTFCVLFCTTPLQILAGEKTGSGGYNAPQHINKPYIVLVSIDGFGWDYMDRFPTPNLDRLAASGSRAERLIPVFPTLTFPNHYSIATGLYPNNHGIVANSFPDHTLDRWYFIHDRTAVEDPVFYSGEPIWVTAESQGMVAAAFFFVGTEAAIQGVSPTHWRSYDDDIQGNDRVDQVVDWLGQPAEVRPHLVTLYFEDVDDHSHWYGIDSDENRAAVERVDSYIGRLVDGINKLPHHDRVNVIVVSDHGQGAYLEDQQPFLVEDIVELEDMRVIEGGSYLFMHFEQHDPERAEDIATRINAKWQHGSAYTATTAPPAWHIGGNPRFADVILVPDQGYAVLSSLEKVGKINAGDHGWAPESTDMHGVLIASGPDIQPGVPLGAVNNIDIYPLLVSLLGLKTAEPIDGDPATLSKLIRARY